jgi:tetratricopeptide (TPR) repeat protein
MLRFAPLRPLFTLALVLAPLALRATPPNPPAPPPPLDFPVDVASIAPESADVLAESEALNAWLGGYPPRVRDAAHRQQLYTRWRAALAGARAVQQRDGDTVPALLVLGRLYRQGHNLDVRECGEKAVELFERAVTLHPDSDPLLLESSYLYLSINPKFAPRGESALLRLRELRGTDRDLEVERGFIFAYLYQDRLEEAKRQVDRCLEFAPQDRMLQGMQAALKKTKRIERIEGVPPAKK